MDCRPLAGAMNGGMLDGWFLGGVGAQWRSPGRAVPLSTLQGMATLGSVLLMAGCTQIYLVFKCYIPSGGIDLRYMHPGRVIYKKHCAITVYDSRSHDSRDTHGIGKPWT